MKLKIIFLSLLAFCNVFAQKSDIWTYFYDDEEYLFGFKNSKGEVMIEPKFMGFTSANKFDKIAAFMEDTNGEFSSYYMLKNGKKFAKDSLYVFDMAFDCENEGFIKFRDPKTGNVGMFNTAGKVAIPALYNDMTPFENGLSVALKGAKLTKIDDEHSFWAGGENLLINTKNVVLVKNFQNNQLTLDFHSLRIQSQPEKSAERVSFLGTNGKYYSFIDNEKLFENFLNQKFFKNLSKKSLLKNSYEKIVYWDEEKGWISQPAKEFLEKNHTILLEKLEGYKNKKNVQIRVDSSTPLTEDMEQKIQHHYNNCGRRNMSKYPFFSLIITYYDENGVILDQDLFSFLRTEKDIKFISCTIRNHTLK